MQMQMQTNQEKIVAQEIEKMQLALKSKIQSDAINLEKEKQKSALLFGEVSLWQELTPVLPS